MNVFLKIRFGFLAAWLLAVLPASANIPGGGTGTGANITLTSTSTTATMSNGIVSIVMTKSNAQITTINYTFNNTGATQTLNLLSGNPNGGKLYWEHSNNQGLDFTGTYTVVADPATNGGDYAEISLSSTTQANMPFAVIYSMRRGSPGFYVTAIWTHDGSNDAFSMGECRNNIYAGSIFNWMSVDATRNKLMQVSGGTSIGVPTAPVECSLWTNGVYQGRYEDKYKYSAAWGDQRVWGWSSVGAGGKNVGLWDVSATSEYYNGGPLHAELMCHIGTTILNMFNGNHYEMGTDGSFVAGETWGKVCGPYFVYCNNIPNTITDPVQASQALYNDALAQGTAEAGAWPYSWFSNPNYAGPANRGTVTGRIVINDTSNPNATASNLWVGLIQQPVTSTGTYDFQQWMKPYQFWVHTDADGNFTVPAVIAGSNYTLYAFGQGAAGTFMSQAQTGGSPPFLANIPAAPFSVTVTGGATTALGNVTWTPTRVGPTVFEIGYPDRTGRKFKHGEDWWVGDIGPSPTSPSPVWTKFMEFPFDFPSGLNYTVGTSRWSTDWNFIQPTIYSSTGAWSSSSSTITFNLASAPAGGTQASLHLGIASDYRTALIVTVNGTVLVSNGSTIIATPSALPSTGFFPSSDDSNSAVREGINGAFSDERITFPGTQLKAGANTIKIAQRLSGTASSQHHAMYEYLRLELTNYVPPAPAGVTAFAGNNSALVTWPAVPGATSYKVLRSAVSGGGYAVVATGVTGPVSGSGPTNATYVDNTAFNGTTYYYVVQSTNPVNSSVNSAQSAGVTPSSGAAGAAPAAPTGLTVTPDSGSVTLNWTASSGASLYTVKRSTLTYNGGGTTIPLNTITLTNSVTATSYTDTSVTNGTLYSYSVSATNSAGSSSDSPAAGTTPLGVAPTVTPANVTAVALQNSNSGDILLNWTTVPGAVGYVVQRSTTLNGTYTILSTVSSLTATDYNLSPNTTYYYKVATMNSGGTSGFVTVSATTPPAAPASPIATPGNSKVTLGWTAATGATSYVIGRATTSGGSYATIASAATGTSYVDTTALNAVTYYYVIAATGTGGTGDVSVEVSATPVGVTSLVWNGNVNTAWDFATANWLSGGSASLYADGGNVILNDTATTTTVAISGTVSPISILVNTAGAYSVSGAGSIAGAAALTKSGSGTLTISSINAFTGGATLNSGILTISDAAALGSGTVTLAGGTWATGALAPLNPILVTADSTITGGNSGGTQGIRDVSGSGVLTLSADSTGVFDLEGDVSGFTGTFAFGGTGSFRFFSATNSGSSAANFDLGTRSLSARSGAAFNLGALAGQAGSFLGMASNSSSGSCIYTIGGKNIDTSFAGVIANGSASKLVGIVKTGSGTQTLSGVNTYTGTTTVTSGKLSVTGSLAATPVTVATTGTLGGIGPIAGAVACNGTLAPGVTVGTLTLGGGLTLGSTSTLAYDLGTTSDLAAVTGNLTLDGTVNVTGTGLASGTYTLVTYSGTLTNLTLNVGTLPAGCTATVNTATAGQVKLVVVNSTNAAPQITVGPTAAANPVTTSSTSLTVTATDDAGEGNLIYTWSATGPAAVGFSPNGTNAAKNATATFSAAGSYTLTITVRDVPGLTAVNSTNVSVNATPTTLTVSPSSATLAVNATQAFTATVLNQFGASMSNPSVSWSASGGGTVSAGGLFTAVTAGGPYQVTATSGSASSGVPVTVTKIPATVTLGNLAANYDGTPKSATATTTPGGLPVILTYNGSTTAPTATGSYAVVGTISDPGYMGTANGSLVISRVPIAVTWTGAADYNWNTSTTVNNWSLTGNAVYYQTGDTVSFTETGAAASLINLAANVQPAAVIVNAATKNYTFSGAGLIAGTATLTKSGAGSLTLGNANTYNGETTLNAGTIVLGTGTTGAAGAVTAGPVGINTLNLNGGVLAFGANSLVIANAINVTGTTVIGQSANYAETLSGPLSGGGTLRNYNSGSAVANDLNFTGNLSGFTGTIDYTGSNSDTTAWWRVGSTDAIADLSNATVNLNAGTGGAKNFGFANGITGATLKVGELTGGGTFQGAFTLTPPAGVNTLEVGAGNSDTTFSGVIGIFGAWMDNIALTKVGTGTLTLSGNNVYYQSTTVTAGKLSITGSLAGTSGVSVQSGAALDLGGGTITSAGIQVLADGGLGGYGTLTGTLANGGTVACGPGGNLVVNGNVTNTGGIQFAAGNGVSSGLMVVNGDLSLAGTVGIALAPGTVFGRYPLMTYSGVLTNAPALLTGIPVGTNAHLSTTIAGQVDLVIDDSDEDNLPDSWEQTYFNSLDQTASGDGDDDGSDNLVEYRLNLNPANGSSSFHALYSGHILTWPSAPGIVFTVKRSLTLDGGNWQTLGIVTGGAGTTATYTDSTNFEKAFYRIEFAP